MKKIIFHTLTLSLILLSSNLAFALANSDAKKELLFDIKTETKKCVVQHIAVTSESQNTISFESVCDSLKIVSSTEAQIEIEGQWFTARITESAESDGGDLDDLTIFNSNGKVVATKTNIPSYDNIIVAMAGDSHFGKNQKK